MTAELVALTTDDVPLDGLWYPAEAFAAAAPGPVDVRIVPGADHFYSGCEDEVGELVADWLVRALDGPSHQPRQASSSSS